MKQEDKKYLKSSKMFFTLVCRLRKQGDKGEARLLELYQAAEPNPNLWTSWGRTFDTALNRGLSYSARRYRKWQRVCKVTKKSDRNVIGIHGVVALEALIELNKLDEALADMLEAAKDIPLSESHAKTIAKGYKPKTKSVVVEMKAKNKALEARIKTLEAENGELKVENETLKVEVRRLKAEVRRLKRPRKVSAARRPVAQA